MKEETQTVKFIPLKASWRGLLPVLLMLYENGKPEARKAAHDELKRMAEAADIAADAVRPLIEESSNAV